MILISRVSGETIVDATSMALDLKAKIDAVVTPDLKRKVVAWWYGVEPEDLDWPEEDIGLEPEPLEAEETPETADTDPMTAEYGLDHFMAISQALWGEGFVTPGGAQYIDEWGPQLSLTKEKSSLFLGSGLGGQAREISKTTGAWVLGYDRFGSLVDEAAAQAEMAGMSRNALSETYDPESIELPEDKFQAVLVKEEFTFVEDKARLFETVAQALTSGGLLMFTEYVHQGDAIPVGKADAWFGSLLGQPHLWSEQDYVSKLEACGLDIHINEDYSERYIDFISSGWRRYREIVEAVREGEESDAEKARLLHFVADSAEHWTRVVEALGSGELQVRRFLARKP